MGYYRVAIGGKAYYVHRLVAEKYVPNPYNKPQVNHIGGNKLNNNYKNLEWVTDKENKLHATKHRLLKRGEDCSWSKLNEEKVRFIRNNKDISITQLSQMFKVGRATIRDVRNYIT